MRNHLLYRTSAHYVQEVAEVVIQSVCGKDGAAVAECGQNTRLAGATVVVVSRQFMKDLCRVVIGARSVAPTCRHLLS